MAGKKLYLCVQVGELFHGFHLECFQFILNDGTIGGDELSNDRDQFLCKCLHLSLYNLHVLDQQLDKFVRSHLKKKEWI